MAEHNGLTYEETLEQLKLHYDGYHFSINSEDIFNPYSIINALDDKEFNSYWFTSGTPTFLVELLQQKNLDMLNLDDLWVNDDRFDTPTEKLTDPIPVLFQSGYLTIKGYERRGKLYHLCFPNQEVRQGFSKSLVRYYTAQDMNRYDAIVYAYSKNVLINDDMGAFMPHLKAFYDKFPYTIINNNERHYQAVIFTIFTMLGEDVKVEHTTSDGRIDLVLKTGAANGGKAQISYSSKFTIQSLGKKADIFDAPEYIEYHKYLGDIDDALLQKNGYNGQNTNWYDEVFENSLAHQHSLTLQASNGKGRFLASLNILNNDGIVKGSKDTYKRFTGQINADYDIYKWLNVTTNTSFEKWKTKGVTRGYGSLLNSVVSIDPLTPAYISNVEDLAPGMKAQVEAGGAVPRDPSHNNDYYGTSKYVEDATGNPLYQRDRHDTWNSGINVRGTVAANIKPFKGFTFTSRLGYRITQSNYHNYETPYWLSSMAHSENYTIEANTNNGLYYQWENFANYLTTIGKHTIGAMAGMSFTKNHWDNSSISSTGGNILTSYEPNFHYINYLLADATKNVGNAPSDATELSYFGRVSYSYDNRYFMQVNFRRDAFDTSKLSKKARWGNFPSVSAGWAISNEKFFKDNISRDAISFLKLRGSWGQNGNVNILSDYRYASTIALNQSFYQYNPSIGDGKLTLGSKPSGLANPDLKWETSEQVDLGLDARFLNDRLTLGLDWYRKTTKDLLIEIAPIPEIGVNKRVVNTGKVLNSGLDFELGWRDHIKDFKYSVTVNGSTLKNEVKEVSNLVSRLTEIGIDGFNNQLKPTFEAGHQVWYFRGYKYAGVAEDGSALYYNKNGETTSAPTDEDKQDLGSGIPKFTYGITLNAEYKGFDLTVFGTGSAGNKIYNLMVSADRPLINGIDTYWKDSWRADRTNAKYPDMKKVATDWKFFSSDAAVFSGSYFKIKQIQLGYTLPKAISSVAGISNLRVYCSLDDFFTITKYPGADPETASINSGASRGFDNGTYPTSKKVVFGINVTF